MVECQDRFLAIISQLSGKISRFQLCNVKRRVDSVCGEVSINCLRPSSRIDRLGEMHRHSLQRDMDYTESRKRKRPEEKRISPGAGQDAEDLRSDRHIIDDEYFPRALLHNMKERMFRHIFEPPHGRPFDWPDLL